VRNCSLLLIVFLSLIAGATRAFAEDLSTNAKAAAQAMVDRFADSWNRADGKAYGENYWPEAELVNPSGAIVDGQAAIVQEHVDLWNTIFKGSHATGRVRKIRMLGPDYMMVDFDVEVSNVAHLPPGSPTYADGTLRNHLKHILEKRNGQWRVIAAQNTFIAPPRQH
jgi:uncharacterized protein (TIGR02246 family)